METEDEDFWRYAASRKDRCRIRRRQQRMHKMRLIQGLIAAHGMKTSIMPDGEWENGRYISNGRILRAKNSHMQQWMKKYTNRIVRNLPNGELGVKGNQYRRYFDYWWTWL